MRYLNNQKQQGFSLLEMLIALLIGLLLLGGAISIFISNGAVSRLQGELHRMQGSGRFIIDFMSREIRMAGYYGCQSEKGVTPNVIANNPPPLLPVVTATLGYDVNGGALIGQIPAVLQIPMFNINGDASSDLITTADVINIQRIDECAAYIVGNWDTTADPVDPVVVSAPNGTSACSFQGNTAVIVSDCANADVFQIGNATVAVNQETLTVQGNNGDAFSSATYAADAHISIPRNNTFFIATNVNGDNALYVAQWSASDNNGIDDLADFVVSELADRVDDMQILYGEDTGGTNPDANVYVRADQVTNVDNIRSVRISLLLSSDDGITTAAAPGVDRVFLFNGADANTDDDRKLRLVFSTTVTLRNLLP